MGLISNTGLLASVTSKASLPAPEKKLLPELRFEVTPAPFILRPYAGLYNPFAHGCSVLCNHPADRETKEFVRKFKDAWATEGKSHHFHEDLSRFQDASGTEKDKNKTPHDIVTEDMFRRYTETDSRPLTPAPTLASGKSRGSRRCLTPDQPARTAIVLDLRRSHSQETLYYHTHTTSETTAAGAPSGNDQSVLPSLSQSDSTQLRVGKLQERLPPLASPLVLATRAAREPLTVRPTVKVNRSEVNVNKTQLKALNLGKPAKGKKEKGDKSGPSPATERSREKESVRTEGSEPVDAHVDDDAEPEMRRRGKRGRRPRGGDRLASAALGAHAQHDPETQIAGIGGDSHNPSSRGSIAPALDEDLVVSLPGIKPSPAARKTDSFLDDDILKYLHREVDEDAIETEFNVKRRYVLEEAYRTRPERARGFEMTSLLRELAPAGGGGGGGGGLGDWLHIPRVFSRQNAVFSLPIDSHEIETLTPMEYAARYVTLKKSKQLLYLTVLRKFRPMGYKMPVKDIEAGLMLMMGGILGASAAAQLSEVMQWRRHEERPRPGELRLTLLDTGARRTDQEEPDEKTINYRTWCGLCAICERMYGRFPPRDQDLPDGIELSDFTSLETKLATLKVDPGLAEILHVIQTR